MSWSIYAKGSKDGVRKKVEAATIGETSPELEKTQHAKIKELLLTTIDGVQSDLAKGEYLDIEASGSAYFDGNVTQYSNFTVKFNKIKLDILEN